MPTRSLTYWNIVPTARLLAAAFEDEALMGIHLHPHSKQYPDDMYLFYTKALRQSLYAGPDNVHLVTYDENNNNRVTGYARWVRKREVPRRRTIYQLFMSSIMNVINYIESIFYVNRALEASRTDMLNDLDPLVETYLKNPRREIWYLSLLGVDPTAHKSGQGRQLVSYGLQRAQEEDIPAGLVSSAGAEGFYRRMGFDLELGRIADVQGDNSFRDVEGGLVMFTR